LGLKRALRRGGPGFPGPAPQINLLNTVKPNIKITVDIFEYLIPASNRELANRLRTPPTATGHKSKGVTPVDYAFFYLTGAEAGTRMFLDNLLKILISFFGKLRFI